MKKHHYSILYTIIGFLHLTYGCTINGVNWLVPVTKGILDTYRGEVFSGQTQSIQAIISVTQREGLNKGPYFDVSLENSLLIIKTNADFDKYEEIETQTSLGYTISLRCTDSSTRNLVFVINLTDTNNNDPIFLPTDTYEFTIAPPVPPGFMITNCLNDILVRDIDLTTHSIDFKIEGSDLFEISFDPSSQVPKEFKATLKTTNLIRSIPEPIKLTVTATDVDLTEGPPRTASATVVIAADSQFEFPDEPIFSQPFYLANYKSDNDFILQDKIFLMQGYDKDVKFSFESDHSEYFHLVIDQNNLSFNMKSPIPVSLFQERQIYLIVKATREHTSGATATVILKLPEDTRLEFENAIYEGTITDNALQLTDLKLKQGYEGVNIKVDIESEYTFRANVESNVIKISMDPLPADVIQNNNVINLQVTASNNRTTAVTVVTLEIVKDDYTTPVFENNFYSGSYSTETGLTLEQIVLTQGFDNTVKITLEGEHFELFQINQDGPKITLTSSTIPPDIFNEQNIVISVVASKPRTVGAHATVKIALPSVTNLEFENGIYEGTITDNVLQLTDLKLKQGYEGFNITVDIESEYNFRAKVESNVIKLSMDPLPTDVIQNNNFINLQVTASNNRTTAVTVVTLEIVKDDLTTPVFENNFYTGSYSTETGLTLEQIVLTQGFDNTVKITLEGEHFEHFQINQDGPRITLTSSTIPPDIFNERNIVISLVASKPRTVGAHATVKIALPSDTSLEFENAIYEGTITDNVLQLTDLKLKQGYEGFNITVDIESEYDFKANVESNVIKISMDPLPADVIQNNNFINLQVTASNNRTTAVTVVTLEIVKDDLTTPVFENNFYSGSYSTETGLTLEQIVLTQGFDKTVKIALEGEHFELFQINQDGPKITLASSTIPPDIFNERNIVISVVASKPRTVGAHAIVNIALPSDTSLEFENAIYEGTITDNILQLTDLKLIQGYEGFNITVDIESEYTFRANVESNVIKISMDPLPADVIQNNNFINLQVTASNNRTTAVTVVTLEIVKDDLTTPVFENNFYSGSYSTETGLTLEQIVLTQGFDKTVKITLEGEHFEYFKINQDGPKITLTSSTIPPDIFNERNIVISVVASKPRTVGAHATIKIALPSEPPVIDDVSFDQILYNGKLEDGVLAHDKITLSGFDGTNIQITGEHSALFRSELTNGVVKVEASGAEIPKHLTYILLELQAASAKAILLMDISLSEPPVIDDVSFDQILYNGKLEDGVLAHDKITLSGFDGTNIQITGEHSALFRSELTNGVVKVEASGAEIPKHLSYILLELQAASAKAVLLIDISLSEPPVIDDVSFDQILYNGKLEDGVLAHDKITLSGFDGTNIQITGEHNALFRSELTNGVVRVEASGAEMPKHLTYILLELQAASAKAVLLIDISLSEPPVIDDVSFDQILYNGKLEDGVLAHDKITLSGFDGTNIQITGEHSALFRSELTNGVVKVEASGAEIPKHLTYILLELQAASAKAVLLIDISLSEPPVIDDVSFDQILYNGKLEDGVLAHDKITLSGFDGTNIQITGEHSALFRSELTNGVVKVEASGAEIPKHLTYILLELQAASAKAVLLIDISLSEPPVIDDVSFDQILYNGKLEDGVLAHDTITLSGFDGTNIQITGEHNALFRSELTNGVVRVEASGAEIPKHLTYILLKLQAASAKAVLLIDISLSAPPVIDDVSFDQILYNGKLQDGVLAHDKITLSGFDGTNIQITGEHSALFRSELTNGVVKVEASGVEIPKHLTYISLELQAASARAILLIDVSLTEPPVIDDVSFDQILYNGKLEDGVLAHDKITLSGFDGTNIQITGEHNALFRSELTNGVVRVEASGAEIPKHLTYILLELQAASAKAVLLIDVSLSEPPVIDDVSFDQILYNGKLQDGVLAHDKITLSGFDGTNIQITGEHSALFRSELTNGVVKVEASGVEIPKHLTYISLELQAASARAILLIDVSLTDPPVIDDISFDQILYNGKLQDGVLAHDKITLSGFDGTNIQITGEHSALFRSELTNGVVKVEASGVDIPKHLTYISLELQAASARAILLIDVSFSENPDLPTVSFTSQSYFLWADVQQTGVVGAVEATADNGEAIVYSLSDINEHIQNRINIKDNGEILLTAAFDKGVYKFNAVATSVQSQVQATAPVLLTVDTIPECSNETGLSPLIILERLEEEPHLNLVVLNQNEHSGCKYTLSNVYPKDQSWLYVDNDGLHAKAIDREDGSIAFMTLSQIQVELTLDCDSDEVPSLTERSFGTEDRSDLYSYDDGPNKWVLTDTITFNARRSFVNLIVNDINDNSPIFLGKGNEPIYVGYPVSELEGTVSPRALAELKATDADIGENAAIMYWSREDNLAVSPNTGLVHVRNNAQLENNSRLTIYAIDQNGKGRNGTIDIVVKLLDKNQIVVLTVKDAFLEDEVDVINELSVAVGYEVKVLKAVVIPNNNEELPRRKRDVASNSRASLQLYVYGLLESEPVDINQLTRDINNINVGTINIARIVSLEDHLRELEIGPSSGRDPGLLAATIVLAVLLFIVIAAIAVRSFLIWKKTSKKYKQFSNRNSTESQLSSPNVPKIEVVPKARPNIDEIKRTERRLQKMLETPIENVVIPQADNNIKPSVSTLNDAKVNISSPDAQLPFVIQSIDKLKKKTDESDDDEFGEVTKPRKSVVTFNENVEKIIHIEDVPDDNSSQNSFQIYKL